MRIVILLIACLTLTSFSDQHKFYVSTTDVEFVPEKKEIQVISRVFIDDFENLLQSRYSKSIKLGRDSESNNADRFIERYLNDKLSISINGKTILLQYLGKTYEDDLIKFFLKAEGISTMQTISVRNEILFDVFEDQQNVVHINNQKKIKSLLLMADKEQGTLNFR